MDLTITKSEAIASNKKLSGKQKLTSVSDTGIVDRQYAKALNSYIENQTTEPLLLLGDALHVLRTLQANSIDFVMTSPPYWSQRVYANGGIGLESDYQTYVEDLANIFAEVKRVLKPTGSFWLNIGDTYSEKGLTGIPWRLALHLSDSQGWTIRNDVIWNKLKGGMDNSVDRLGNVHEHVFHFVKNSKGYYYNADAIRSKPRTAKIVNGSIVSATGVSGVRYRRQIELSTELGETEKLAATLALEAKLKDLGKGKISDFRMVIRGYQRVTHSDSEKISGRAKELRDKGYYFLNYHPKGSKPTDIWDIIPEDTQGRGEHFAPYPPDLCRIPLLATCPTGGIVLDPFCGTGTTLFVAKCLGHKSIGIDISENYLNITKSRCHNNPQIKS